MATVFKDEYIFDVDVEKTKEYYKTKTLCNCDECENFYRQAEAFFPALKSFLLDFGIDVARPEEICSIRHKDEVEYLAVSYTAVGRCIQLDKYEIDMEDGGMFLSLVVNESPVYPNEQEDRQCFEFVVYNIRLPWVISMKKSPCDAFKNMINCFRTKTKEKRL